LQFEINANIIASAGTETVCSENFANWEFAGGNKVTELFYA
jgi:hypothetical protein